MPLNDARLTRLRNDIVACIHPDQIWLFSRKEGLDGQAVLRQALCGGAGG